MSCRAIAIYGGGGFAREVAWLVDHYDQEPKKYNVVCFIDDNEDMQGSILNEIPVMSLLEARQRFPEAAVVGAIGSPRTREMLMNKSKNLGFSFETLIHPRVERSRWIEIGKGTVICAGSILTTNITIGEHVQINLDCTIGHDVVMGDYTTLAPGVHVSGWVHFGKRVYIGTGASIINGTKDHPLTLGDDSVVGAGAVVTKSVEPGSTVVGVPAKRIK